MMERRNPVNQERSAFGVTIIDRLRMVIEKETAEVLGRQRVDYDAYSAAKSRGLLEISRLLPTLDVSSSPALIHALRQLETSIIESEKVLSVHLAAAKTISGLISQAMREAQSDGTYCADGSPPSAR